MVVEYWSILAILVNTGQMVVEGWLGDPGPARAAGPESGTYLIPVEFWSKFGQNLVKFGQNLVESGQNLVEFGSDEGWGG